MRPKTSRLFRYLISAFGLGAVIGWSSPSDANIQQIVIDAKATVYFTPIILGTSTPVSSPISYTIYTGRVFGELKPNDPDNNKIITDIDLAPRIRAGLNTSPTLRLSHRAIQRGAAD